MDAASASKLQQEKKIDGLGKTLEAAPFLLAGGSIYRFIG